MFATATATATIGASSSGAQRRSTERVDSAAMPGPMVRTLKKRAWSESDDFDSQVYLGLTTKRAKYASTDEESVSVQSNDNMSVGGSTGDDASLTSMEVDEARVDKRKRRGKGSPSSRRKKRGIEIAVEHMSVDDISMHIVCREVEALTNNGLNGPYWLLDAASDNRCGDLSGLEIEVQPYARSMRRRRRNDSSRMPPAANSDFAIGDEDTMMDVDPVSDDNSSRGEFSDDDDDLSVMSDLTTNSNVHSGADSSSPLFGGVEVRAVNAVAERMQRLSLSTDLVRMDIDADDESVAFRQFLLRSVLVLPQNRHRYFTRAIARSLEALAEKFAKRTRSGRRY